MELLGKSSEGVPHTSLSFLTLLLREHPQAEAILWVSSRSLAIAIVNTQVLYTAICAAAGSAPAATPEAGKLRTVSNCSAVELRAFSVQTSCT